MLRMKRAILPIVLFMVYSGMACALDANDVALLIKNGVHDSVIINMVRNNKMRAPLATSEVLLLNTNGASPALLEFLTRSEASYPAAVVSSQPAVVSESVCSTAAPVVIGTPSPTVISTPTYVSPTYYVSAPYYGNPYRYSYGYGWPHSFGFSYGHRWGGSRHYRRPPPPGHGPPRGGHRGPGGRRR